MIEELERKVKRPTIRKEIHTRLPVITNRDLLKREIEKSINTRHYLPVIFMKNIKG